MAHVSDAVVMPTLEVERLTLKSGRGIVLADFSLRAETGTMLWITGENGVGKSTLLRALALRATATGIIRFAPSPSLMDITFYAPIMGAPAHTTVAEWFRFNTELLPGERSSLAADDPFLPAVRPRSLLSALSTGEAKRLLLWSLLRTSRPFTFLDEPYEHLSPTAKARLTEILTDRSRTGVVVIATNQDVPVGLSMYVLNLS